MTHTKYAKLYDRWAAGETASSLAVDLVALPASDACEFFACLTVDAPLLGKNTKQLWQAMRNLESNSYFSDKVSFGDATSRAHDVVTCDAVPAGEPVAFLILHRHRHTLSTRGLHALLNRLNTIQARKAETCTSPSATK